MPFELTSGTLWVFGIIFIVVIINLLFTFRRIKNIGKRKENSRKYVPPDEEKQQIWRDREIARRVEREQDNAMERVMLKNETLALYETVRRRHAMEDALENRGIDIDTNTDDTVNPDSPGYDGYFGSDGDGI